MIPVDEGSLDRRAGARPSPEALVSLSRTRFEARDFTTSAEASRAAISLRPENAEAFNNLGLALAELGKHDDAIAAFESALRIQPGFELARNNLAWTRAHRAETAH
jgi:Flp pilus assembly protein TadD